MALRVVSADGRVLSGGGNRGGGLSVTNAFEEELKRRMALARAQGWSDDEINRSALIERGIQRNNQAISAAQQRQKQNEETTNNIQAKKPSGLKRFGINAAALLGSTAAGIGSIAAAPFTGGASLAGGFAAGAGIEALRRRALGEDQNLGASLLEGGLTIIPGVGKAVSGARAARAAKLATGATEAAEITRGASRVTQAAGNATRAINPTEAAERIAQIDRRIALANRAGGLDADEARTLLQEKKSLQMIPKNTSPAVTDATQRTAEIVPKKTFRSTVKEQFEPSNEGMLFKKGTKMRGNARGITPGAGFRGDILGLEDATSINQTIDETFKQLGKKMPASAEKQLETIVQARKSIGKQMGDAIIRDNVTFDDAAKATLGQRLRAGLDEIADFDPNKKAHVELFNNYARRVDQAKDMRQLEKERKAFDQAINFNRNSQSVDPLKEQVARAFRDSIDEFVTDASPVSKELKGQFRRLKQAENFMTHKNTLRPKGFEPFGTSVNGRGFGGEMIQRGTDATGKVLQSASKIFSRPATKQLAAQYGLRLLSGTYSPNENPADVEALMKAQAEAANGFTVDNAFGDPQSNDEAMLNEIFNSGATDFESVAQGLADLENGVNNPAAPGGADVAGAETNPFGFTREDLLKAAHDIVADPSLDTKTQGYLLDNIKDLNQLLNDYDKVRMEEQKASGKGGAAGGLNVTKVTAQQYGLAQSGATSAEQLKGLLQKDPNVLNRTRVPGRGVDFLGIGGTISNAAKTGDFDAIGYNIADTILRLRTGATANESEVRKLQSQIMPRAGDSQQTIQTKLRQIDEIFNGVLGMAQQQPSSPSFDDFDSIFGGGGGMDFSDPYQQNYY